MGLKQQLEQDIAQFFRDIDDMLPEGKKKALELLIEKYCHLSSAPVKWDKSHFEMIKSHAITLFKDKAYPKKFNNSYREFSTQEAPNVCLIEATISHLHSEDCLKKLPKFDVRED